MIITKIEKQKYNENRFSVFIDYEFAFGIDKEHLIKYNLCENMCIDKTTFDEIVENIVFNKARDKAISFLSYKMRSEKQLKQKLADNDFSDYVINKVLTLLKKYGYINDYDYAKNFVYDKINVKSYGSYKVKYELKQAGISDDIIKEVLFDTYETEMLQAVYFLKSKINKKNINSQNIDYKQKQNLYASLFRRGFSYDIIKEAFNQVFLEE